MGGETACAGWSVYDVALHLLGNDLFILSRRRDGHDGQGLSADPPDWDAFVAALDELNEGWVSCAARLSPRLLGELLIFTGVSTFEYFSSLDPDAPGESVSWAGAGESPNWLGVGREFTERWVHQQHIRDAVYKPGLNGPRYVTPVLGILMRSLVPAYEPVEAPADTTVAVNVEGRGGGGWAVRRTANEWELFEGRERDAYASVELDQDTAWRYLVRNIDTRTARARMSFTGDSKLAKVFLTAVAAIVRR